MSMMIATLDGQFHTFREYCLSESIRPRSTDYGTNEGMNDQRVKFVGGHGYTFMAAEGVYWVVSVSRNGTIGFGRSNTPSLNIIDYSDDRQSTRSALLVFNRVFWVILEILKKSEMKDKYVVRFDAASPSLGKVYDRLVRNRWFLDELSEQGYIYKGIHDGEYIFAKDNSSGVV